MLFFMKVKMQLTVQHLWAIVAGLSVISLVLAGDDAKEAKKPKGLQIGVKKRIDPENCPIKSRKGDSLHMHYTVSFLLYKNVLLIIFGLFHWSEDDEQCS
jgi:hypothetical protein